MAPGAPQRTSRFVHHHQARREVDREATLHQAMLELHVLHDGQRVVETPDGVVFPFEEHTSYTAAAVILAADSITGASPAAHVFTAAELFD